MLRSVFGCEWAGRKWISDFKGGCGVVVVVFVVVFVLVVVVVVLVEVVDSVDCPNLIVETL